MLRLIFYYLLSRMEKPHKKLALWGSAMDLVTRIYHTTESYPVHEGYGLVSQMRRAAVSIPSNIAEGAARQTRKEFFQFLHVTRGSLSELDTQLELSKRLGYIQDDQWSELDAKMVHVDKMINGLIKKLRQTVRGTK